MKILVTGGSGTLGKELKKSLVEADYPDSNSFDITDYNGMEKWLLKTGKKYNCILHCAAFTSPPRIDKNPQRALEVNIIGTANIVKLCIEKRYRLIYISTDYVFDGKKGLYAEKDPVNPVNKYAWSKMGGECAVRLYENSLIVRLSFGPDVFPYEAAFIDQWTSREAVSKSAQKIVHLAKMDITGVIHIGSERRTVYEYAKSLDVERNINALSIEDMDFEIPRDTSLDTRKYNRLMNSKKE